MTHTTPAEAQEREAFPSLYERTGDIKDINTLLVPRAALRADAAAPLADAIVRENRRGLHEEAIGPEEHAAIAAPQPPATQPQGETLTDEQITEAVTRAYDRGNGVPPIGLWTGFKRDESGQYTVPNLRPMDVALVRLGVNLASSNAAAGQLAQDTAMLDWLRENSCDLRCIDVPTGQGDGDIHWVVIEHHMAKPYEREIGRCYTDEPRDAIRVALQVHNKGTT